MGERHPDGYRRHHRTPIGKRPAEERVDDWAEIWRSEWDEDALQDQGERCMDCGVATCMGGCPIGNVVPEWNDLIYRGDWKDALEALHATNNFPEFTGYTCPAPCEDACVLAVNDEPVTIKSIERAIVDRGWAEGWIDPQPPEYRTEYTVGIVGSGPAGLAAAQQLNRVGHRVTVFERDEIAGGLMTLGIPEFKFERWRVQRRVEQLRNEGIDIQTGVAIGEDRPPRSLVEDFDAVCLAVGAQSHRDLEVPGRDLDGVHFAMPYLKQANRRRHDDPIAGPRFDAEGKHVLVLGEGDTGADCVATANRQGAAEVVQVGINPRRPTEREWNNPWPEPADTYHETYAQEEGGRVAYELDTTRFVDEDGDGRVDRAFADRVSWRYDEAGDRFEREVIEADVEFSADLVLIAIGFEGPDTKPFGTLDLATAPDGSIETDERMQTTVEGVFAAGDANTGASLVVWAIGEGRDVAYEIDRYLTGDTRLPRSLRTSNPPVGDP